MKQRQHGKRQQLHGQQQRPRPSRVSCLRGSAHPPAVQVMSRIKAAIGKRHGAATQCSRQLSGRSAVAPVHLLRPLLALMLLCSACAPDVERYRPLAVGDPAPPFAAAVLGGDTLRLQDLRGETVMLNVWATWCAPCREEMPGLQALHHRYASQGLRVVGVSIDSRGAEAAIRSFLEDHGITFTILHDPGEVVQRQFRTSGVPETFLIDAEGSIVHRWIGKFDPLDADATRRVEAALAR
jgi:cytochrome c biogenesis protein CcmG, thiol:disulfide interchange protein DsbE